MRGRSPRSKCIAALPDPRDARGRARRARCARATAVARGGAAHAAVQRARRMRSHRDRRRRAPRADRGQQPDAARRAPRHALMHILVDEFQDTSRDQYELLRTLTQDWSEGDGRTLFLVGDPMQSIYGFRNAEVGRFSTVRAAGLGAMPAAAARTAAQFPLGAGAGPLVQRSVRARVPGRRRRAQERRAAPGERGRAHRSEGDAASLSRRGRLRPARRGGSGRRSDRRIW